MIASVRQLGISRSTASILLYRLVQAAAGLVTLALIPTFLTSVEQGFYYTFASVAAASIILEMGLSTVLVQVGAHEFATLAWGARGTVHGDDGARVRFLLLFRKSVIWYGLAALTALVALYPAGYFFISSSREAISSVPWERAWWFVVLGASVNLLSIPFLALIEGTGLVAETYGVRVLQLVVGAIATWMTLIGGGGIYAAAAMTLAGSVVVLVWIVWRKPKLLLVSLRSPTLSSEDFSWRREVWPMQWRLGVSWLCGYLLVQMHTPLLFRVQGAIEAGKMGLTMTVGNMIGILSMSWMTSKIPHLARSAAQRDWMELDTLFRRGWWQANVVFIVGAAGFLLLRVALENSSYGDRFLASMETAGLLAAILLSHVTGLLAVYLRAHKREPFMWPSVIGALLVAVGAMLAAPQWSAAGIVSVLFAVNLFFGLPVAVWLWISLRRKWHA